VSFEGGTTIVFCVNTGPPEIFRMHGCGPKSWHGRRRPCSVRFVGICWS